MSFFFFFNHFMTFSGKQGQQQYVQTNLKNYTPLDKNFPNYSFEPKPKQEV